MRLQELIDDLDEYLEIDTQPDYCPNGLQVEACDQVERVVGGVTASQALFDAALERGADLVLVHHGLFWSGWEPRIRGVMRDRIAFLLETGISLAGYHLPLDRHPEVGNNAQIVRRLGLQQVTGFAPHKGRPVGLQGRLLDPLSREAFQALLRRTFGELPHAFTFGPEQVSRVAVLSGKGDHDLQTAIDEGVDAYVTGEAGVPSRELAREAGVHFFAAGHHVTERWGVQALGDWLAGRHGLHFEYVEVENPV